MFKRLHIYTVHLKPAAEKSLPVFVKEGFNIPAFLFGPVWTAYHRLWFATALNAAYFIATLAFGMLGYLSQSAVGALQIGQALFIGFEGGNWQRNRLTREGYVTVGITSGQTLELAQRRYLDLNM